jgi:hypothetical protein
VSGGYASDGGVRFKDFSPTREISDLRFWTDFYVTVDDIFIGFRDGFYVVLRRSLAYCRTAASNAACAISMLEVAAITIRK